ncbi:MAG: fatty acid desaturase, partial [Ferruginibacter sp.]|nr:fatty acid desaturase [Cytophagales bacterium]
WLLCLLLVWLNWQATLIVFLLPLLISRALMMMGNWAQHAFIDPTEPGNPYRNSITCINSAYNHQCFNDGYHIGHHLKPNLHWTEHPAYFLANQPQYVHHRAIVFEGIDYFMIFLFLMFKRYDRLAHHFVNLDNVYQSSEEVIALLKERTQKIGFVTYPSE